MLSKSLELTISTANPYLNSYQDSILFIDVSIINEKDKKLKIPKIISSSKGFICATQAWKVLIVATNIDSTKQSYTPEFAQCHLKTKPYLTIRKNEEYHTRLQINFNTVQEGDLVSASLLNHSGEFELEFALQIEGMNIVHSNKIKIIYNYDPPYFSLCKSQ